MLVADVALLALPITVIGTAFAVEFERLRRRRANAAKRERAALLQRRTRAPRPAAPAAPRSLLRRILSVPAAELVASVRAGAAAAARGQLVWPGPLPAVSGAWSPWSPDAEVAGGGDGDNSSSDDDSRSSGWKGGLRSRHNKSRRSSSGGTHVARGRRGLPARLLLHHGLAPVVWLEGPRRLRRRRQWAGLGRPLHPPLGAPAARDAAAVSPQVVVNVMPPPPLPPAGRACLAPRPPLAPSGGAAAELPPLGPMRSFEQQWMRLAPESPTCAACCWTGRCPALPTPELAVQGCWGSVGGSRQGSVSPCHGVTGLATVRIGSRNSGWRVI